jgi:hypothetical protein
MTMAKLIYVLRYRARTLVSLMSARVSREQIAETNVIHMKNDMAQNP